MELCGWETRDMFKRYCIKDEAALAAAVGRRYGQVAGKSEPSSGNPDSVTSGATTQLAPRPTAGHQTLDLGMVVRIHRGQFPSAHRVP